MVVVQNIDLINDVFKYDVILVGSGIKNTKGNGLQYKITKNFNYAYQALNATKFDDPNKLGTCLVVNGKKGVPTIVYCFITKGRYRPDICPDALNYEALDSCLELVGKNFKGKKIASTFLGESPFEGGGDKSKIWDAFNKHCKDLDITLYDYEQLNYRIEDNIAYKDMRDKYLNKEISEEEYYLRKSKYIWERHFGCHNPIPDMPYRKIQAMLKDKEQLNEYLEKNKENLFVF